MSQFCTGAGLQLGKVVCQPSAYLWLSSRRAGQGQLGLAPCVGQAAPGGASSVLGAVLAFGRGEWHCRECPGPKAGAGFSQRVILEKFRKLGVIPRRATLTFPVQRLLMTISVHKSSVPSVPLIMCVLGFHWGKL